MIRTGEQQKIPLLAVIGAREAEAGGLSLRSRRDGDLGFRSAAEVMAAARRADQERAAGLDLPALSPLDRSRRISPESNGPGLIHPTTPMVTLLAGDIGGTKTLLSLYRLTAEPAGTSGQRALSLGRLGRSGRHGAAFPGPGGFPPPPHLPPPPASPWPARCSRDRPVSPTCPGGCRKPIWRPVARSRRWNW